MPDVLDVHLSELAVGKSAEIKAVEATIRVVVDLLAPENRTTALSLFTAMAQASGLLAEAKAILDMHNRADILTEEFEKAYDQGAEMASVLLATLIADQELGRDPDN